MAWWKVKSKIGGQAFRPPWHSSGLDSGHCRFNVNVNVNVNVIVVLNANVLRLDEDRRQRRSGISFWT